MAKHKTPDYTRKAINKYHNKFERFTVSLPIGSKEWIAENTGLSLNAYFNMLFEQDRSERETGNEGSANIDNCTEQM